MKFILFFFGSGYKYDTLSRTTSHPERLVVRMHVAEGLTYQEIAAQLGLSDNTVRTHLKRAYKVLRDHLSCFLAGFPFIFNFS